MLIIASALHPVEMSAIFRILRQTYVRDVFFQFFHPLQGCILGFSIFQQSSYIKHIVQVSLNLYLQLVTLCVFQLLQTRTWQKMVLASLRKQDIPRVNAFCLLAEPSFSTRRLKISSTLKELQSNSLSEDHQIKFWWLHSPKHTHIFLLILPAPCN